MNNQSVADSISIYQHLYKLESQHPHKMDEHQSVAQLQQLQRQFQVVEFGSIVTHLLDAMQLSFNLSIEDLYQQIKEKNGKVLGKDILQLLHALKLEAELEKQIDAQINFYLSTIQQLQQIDKNSLSIGQFFVYFVMKNPKKGIVTDQIQQKISQLKTIEIKKLHTLIQTIQNARAESRILKPHEISKLNLSRQQYTLDSINACSEIQAVQALKNIIFQNIKDESIRQNSLLFLQKINKKMMQTKESGLQIQNTQHSIQEDHQKCNQQISKLEHIIQQRNNTISNLYLSNEKYQEEIRQFQQKCQQDFIDTISDLQSKNQHLSQQNNDLLSYCQQLEEQLKWFKANWKSRNQQSESYRFQLQRKQSYALKLSRDDSHSCKQSEHSIMKEKLKQACTKINKLRKQNEKMKVKISDLQTELEAHAIYSGNDTQRSCNPIPLEKINSSFTYEEVTDTFLKNLRKESFTSQSAHHKELYKSISQQKSKQRKLIKQLTHEYLDIKNNSQICQVEDDFNTETQKYKINQFDFMGYLKKQSLIRDVTLFLENETLPYNIVNTVFSSWIYIVDYNGNYQRMGLVFTSQSILFLTQQMKTKFYLHFSNISQMCFCLRNRNCIVLKLKQPTNKINSKLMRDIVININNRSQLLKYLLKHVFVSAFENRLNLTFQKQQKIRITQQGKQIQLSNFKGMRNYIEISICDGINIFEARMHQNYFLSRKYNVMIVVNQIGIIIFERGLKYSLEKIEKQQKLKCILPWMESMQIIDLSQQKKIKIVYPQTEKSYIIQLQSYASSKALIDRLKTQKFEIQKSKQQDSEKFSSIFRNFKKMRSINEENCSSFVVQ